MKVELFKVTYKDVKWNCRTGERTPKESIGYWSRKEIHDSADLVISVDWNDKKTAEEFYLG